MSCRRHHHHLQWDHICRFSALLMSWAHLSIEDSRRVWWIMDFWLEQVHFDQSVHQFQSIFSNRTIESARNEEEVDHLFTLWRSQLIFTGDIFVNHFDWTLLCTDCGRALRHCSSPLLLLTCSPLNHYSLPITASYSSICQRSTCLRATRLFLS